MDRKWVLAGEVEGLFRTSGNWDGAKKEREMNSRPAVDGRRTASRGNRGVWGMAVERCGMEAFGGMEGKLGKGGRASCGRFAG